VALVAAIDTGEGMGGSDVFGIFAFFRLGAGKEEVAVPEAEGIGGVEGERDGKAGGPAIFGRRGDCKQGDALLPFCRCFREQGGRVKASTGLMHLTPHLLKQQRFVSSRVLLRRAEGARQRAHRIAPRGALAST
jgi:hypothetical protein